MLLLGRVQAPPHVVTEWEEFFRADALSAWMVLLISVVSLGSSLYAGRYFRRDLAAGVVTAGRVKEFFVLTPLFTTGMFLVVLANNLGVMWFALEATALSSVLLVALYNRNTSLEAAWKYVILGSLGLALALFGTVFTYAAGSGPEVHGVLPSFNWSHLMPCAGQLDPRMIKLAFVFVLVGYGTKAGLAPMHTWLPDAHSEAPSPTSAMLSGVSLKVALYALLRFHILTTACLGIAVQPDAAAGLWAGVHVPRRTVHPRPDQPQAAAGLFEPGACRLDLRRHRPELARDHLRGAAAHGLPCADQAGALLRGGQHPPDLPHAADAADRAGHGEAAAADGGLHGLAAVAATGLPPFGLFFSEMTILNGGFAAGHTLVSTLVLTALLAAFCGILYQLTRILPGLPKSRADQRCRAGSMACRRWA